MSLSDKTKIAGEKTSDDWEAFKKQLVPGCDVKFWRQAANDYFYKRIETRYLKPIQTLRLSGSLRGEGFAILAIQCSLIEFLESTLLGLSYRFLKRKERLGPNEYSKSKKLFVDFLRLRHPFCNHFTDQTVAEDFYESVRCGLLHEARTKNGWRVKARGPKGAVVDAQSKLVYRDGFENALGDSRTGIGNNCSVTMLFSKR
jgi:hypothetical protein